MRSPIRAAIHGHGARRRPARRSIFWLPQFTITQVYAGYPGSFPSFPDRVPTLRRGQLAAEGILVIEEGVPATTVYSHYRAPGRRGNWRGDYLLAFAMTERRLLVYGATPDRRPPSPFVNVSWPQAKAGGLRATLDNGNLRLCFDFSALYPDRVGQAEVWLRTGQAPAALAAAEAKLS